MRKENLILLISFLLYCNIIVQAQFDCSFSHYSVHDGLSQNTISYIFQDNKGIMWFGTFNGLNKFDGYRFKYYKTISQGNNIITNDRIDLIQEDSDGFLWILTHDGQVFRFDTDVERFYPVTEDVSRYLAITMIDKMPSGKFWLRTNSEGCILVKNRVAENKVPELKYYSVKDKSLPSDNVRIILEDKVEQTWLVTNQGLVRLDVNGNVLSTITITDGIYFRGAVIRDEGLYVCRSDGFINVYDLSGTLKETIKFPIAADLVNIYNLGNNQLLVLSANNGFIVYNLCEKTSEIYGKSYKGLITNKFQSAYIDSYGEAWITMEASGILHFSPQSKEIRYFKPDVDKAGPYLSSKWTLIMEDANGYLWVYPKGGGFSVYNRKTKKLEYFYNRPGDSGRRFSNVVLQAFSDREGNLWMCTYSMGIEKISFNKTSARNVKPNPNSNWTAENEVRALFQDKDSVIWCATRDASVYLLDKHYQVMGKLGENGRLNEKVPFSSLIYCIQQDSKGRIWLGSRNDGVYCLQKHLAGNTYFWKIKKYQYSTSDTYSISNNAVYSIYEDKNGRIWFGTLGGGLNYLDESKSGFRFISFRNIMTNYPVAKFSRIRHIAGNPDGSIWVGTSEGLIHIDEQLADGNISISSYVCDLTQENTLSANDVHSVLISGDTVYIGTFGGGLNRMINNKQTENRPYFEAFNTSTGFVTDIILTLTKDSQGRIWMNSESIVFCFDPKMGKVETFNISSYYSDSNVSYSEAAALPAKDKNILFGHRDGVYILNPSSIEKNSFIPPLLFTRFLLFNNEIRPKDKDSPLAADIDNTQYIKLNYKQSVFTIEFSALDYRNSSSIEYAYKLEGLNDDWIYVHDQRTVTYTNLPSGKYVFHVRSTNADKVWVDNTRSITIIISPPFWRTGWAYLAYFILTLFVLYIASHIFSKFYKLRREVEIEQRMTELKLRFFTDISHEIRTPLTLISSPLQHLLDKEVLPSNVRATLSTVKLNTDRLLRLVNQLLDFRKIQNKKMNLYIEREKIGLFAGHVCNSFSQLATENNINFIFTDNSNQEEIWIDKDKTEKILFNILSNAFKYTDPEQKITCTVNNNTDEINIIVEDEGIGMTKEELSRIFIRFESFGKKYRGNHLQTGLENNGREGTGIGLFLVKELVDMHQGNIDIKSKYGVGTCVTITLKKGKDHFKDSSQYQIVDDSRTSDGLLASDLNLSSLTEEKTNYTVLIIEDNAELRSFVKSIVGNVYHILEAENGEEGIHLAQTLQPNIILSDIMMDGIDGIEVVRRLKSDVSTSHIPIILITAKSELEDKLIGAEVGADDYITKPFSAAYLMARISNILGQRQKLQQIYSSSLGLIKSTAAGLPEETVEMTTSDSRFMKELVHYMNENISDFDLKIEGFLSHFCMSRSLFFKKIKGLTGLSPVEFIREFRIQRAAELIKSEQYNIKEITYMVGISDSRYFSRCFKQKYNLSPSQYRSKYSNNRG